MKLTGKQIKSLQTALLSAFDYEQLRQMLSTELDQNIQQIAPVTNANLTDLIYSVIRFYAAQPEGLHKLATAARAANPQNQELAQVAKQLLAVEWEQLPLQDKVSPAIDIRILGVAAVLLLLAIAGVIYYLKLPKPMGPGYNVAVATFGELSDSGEVNLTDLSREISDWFFSAVESEVAQLPAAKKYALRSPDEIGVIGGATPAERATAAKEKAVEFNAAVLVYGVVYEQDGQHYVQPEFYVDDQATFFYASSIIGPNQLGAPIPLSLPLNPGDQMNVNQALEARSQALQRIIAGLSNFFYDEYGLAQQQFSNAANTPHWEENEGKEIAYLLKGAAALRQYDGIAATEPLEAAEDAFWRAYEINPDFARAQAGLGSVAVLRADQLNAQKAGATGAMNDLLAEAQQWFTASLTAPDQQPSDYIAIKANYGLGQVHSLGGYWGLAGYSLEQACVFYAAVLAEVAKADKAYLDRFAAQAHAELGRVAGLQQDYPHMAEEYRTANAIWSEQLAGKSDLTIARNWAQIGQAEGMQQHYCAAEEAYTQAVMLGEPLDVANSEIEDWKEILTQLKEQELCKHEA